MKKEYINPELQVVLLNMQQHLLAGSVGEDIVGDTVADGDTLLSRLIDEFQIEEGPDYNQKKQAPIFRCLLFFDSPQNLLHRYFLYLCAILTFSLDEIDTWFQTCR